MGTVSSEFSEMWTTLVSSTPSNFGWIAWFIFSLFGPIGHLFLRIFYLNGSLNKPYLFILGTIPPFSFLANLLLKWGYAPPGPGVDVLDWWILLPIIAKFGASALVSYFGFEGSIATQLVVVLIQMASIFIPNMIRMNNNCPKITSDNWNKACVDTYVEFGFAYAITLLFAFAPYLDMVSMGAEFVGLGGVLDDITWSVGFLFAYTLTNTFNQNDMKKYCEAPMDNSFATWITVIISTLLIIGNQLKGVGGGDIMDMDDMPYKIFNDDDE